MPSFVAILTAVNAGLFAVGALLHTGIPVGPLEEPVVVAATMVEVVCAIILGISTMAIFARGGWARRLTVFANVVAILGVCVVTVVLIVNEQPSTNGNTALQIVRAVLGFLGLSSLLRSPRSEHTR